MNLYKIKLDTGFSPDDLVFTTENDELSNWTLLPGGIFALNGSPMGHSTVIVPFESELYLMTSISDFTLSVNGEKGGVDVSVTMIDCSDVDDGSDASTPMNNDKSKGLTPGLLPGVIAGAVGSYFLFNKG